MRRVGAFSAMCVLAWLVLIVQLKSDESPAVFGAGDTHWQSTPFDRNIFRSVSFQTADGLRLEGVAASAGAPAPVYWILHCNARGRTIHADGVQEQLRGLHSLGYGVVAFDYRGFGRNPGVPTEAGVYEDALAAYAYLTQELRVPPSRVILAGRSLGSAVALEVAVRVPSAGLVLFSPIDSVPLTGARLYPWIPVVRFAKNRFDSRAKVDRLRVPTLVIHAVDDSLIPIAAARSLFDAIPGPKLMVETTGEHNDAGFTPAMNLKAAMNRFWPAA